VCPRVPRPWIANGISGDAKALFSRKAEILWVERIINSSIEGLHPHLVEHLPCHQQDFLAVAFFSAGDHATIQVKTDG
jgi:hypothetical protein